MNRFLYEDKEFELMLQKMFTLSGKKVDFYLDIEVPETFLDFGYRSSSVPFRVILGQFQRSFKYVSNAVESVPGLLNYITKGGRAPRRTKVMESKAFSRIKDRKHVNLMIWSNPLFKTINCTPFKAHNLEPMKVSKRQISAFKIIGQFDKRFIIARCLGEGFDFIAALDQHASHERIRLERFISKYLDSELKYALCMTLLGLKTFNEEHKKRFIQDGFVIEQKHGMTQLTITRDLIVIPDDAQIKELLLNLETYYNQSNSHSAISAPILEYIKQRACKGAIKFGQKLTFGECLEIVEELQLCNDPFSCAHGRPSLVPLAQI